MSQLSDLSPSDIESVGKDMEYMRAMPGDEAEIMRFRDDMKRALKESKAEQASKAQRTPPKPKRDASTASQESDGLQICDESGSYTSIRPLLEQYSATQRTPQKPERNVSTASTDSDGMKIMDAVGGYTSIGPLLLGFSVERESASSALRSRVEADKDVYKESGASMDADVASTASGRSGFTVEDAPPAIKAKPDAPCIKEETFFQWEPEARNAALAQNVGEGLKAVAPAAASAAVAPAAVGGRTESPRKAAAAGRHRGSSFTRVVQPNEFAPMGVPDSLKSWCDARKLPHEITPLTSAMEELVGMAKFAEDSLAQQLPFGSKFLKTALKLTLCMQDTAPLVEAQQQAFRAGCIAVPAGMKFVPEHEAAKACWLRGDSMLTFGSAGTGKSSSAVQMLVAEVNPAKVSMCANTWLQVNELKSKLERAQAPKELLSNVGTRAAELNTGWSDGVPNAQARAQSATKAMTRTMTGDKLWADEFGQWRPGLARFASRASQIIRSNNQVGNPRTCELPFGGTCSSAARRRRGAASTNPVESGRRPRARHRCRTARDAVLPGG